MATAIHSNRLDCTYVSQIFMLQELTTVIVMNVGLRNANSDEEEGDSKGELHHCLVLKEKNNSNVHTSIRLLLAVLLVDYKK
jgi:hypothetical protein